MSVSNALSGKGRMSEENRIRIKQIAEQMGYRPNLQARGMQTGKSRIIGVMVPAMGYYEPMVQGIHDTLDKHDYNMLLTWPSRYISSNEHTEEHDKINRLIALRVDGIITRPTFDQADEHYFKESLNMGIPIVAVDRRLSKFDCSFSGTDDRRIGQAAAKHLLALGHRKLAVTCVAQNVSVWQLREEGFIQAIQEFGQGATVQRIELPSVHQPELSIQALSKALSGKDRPSALFATNDDLAELSYQAAEQNNLKIPDDLSVLGCGNQEISRVLRPQLSSFDQRPYEIGVAAAEMLIKSLEEAPSTPAGATQLINAELVERQSCISPATYTSLNKV